MAKKASYGNESISSLKGADRVRLRPAVIFGSDGIEGCEHSTFEIITNSIDEAREGYGKKIIITRYLDNSIEVQDFGRGCPVDYNPNENKYNWELLYCELYAGSKYDNDENGTYQFSLGTNGLGLCSTQYASKYMNVEIKRDGYKYTLHFEKGENVGGLKKEPYLGKDTGTKTHWLPDDEVFTDIKIPYEYFEDILTRQAVVNDGLVFVLKNQVSASKFETKEFTYKNGILDYVNDTVGEDLGFIDTLLWKGERKGKDRADKPEYLVKMNVALNFSNKVQRKEYYHNSSYLEYGGAPDKAVRSAFVSQFDAFFKQNNKYNKNESKVSFADIEESLVLVISSFSNQTSYENQTKKAITNKFIQEALTEFLKHNLEVFFIENKEKAEKVGDQILINKRSREKSEKERLNIKKTLQTSNDMASRVQKFVDCRSKNASERELYI
ncbi:MAG: DNA topoisomerase, partial [Clostridia bacterium]|nr:DNA topoisomerase [Clostridia bacterium]